MQNRRAGGVSPLILRKYQGAYAPRSPGLKPRRRATSRQAATGEYEKVYIVENGNYTTALTAARAAS
jgi:hypothetical protein